MLKKIDLFKIAAMRLKNKSSVEMIFAMAFGLIMIIQVVWLIFAFNFNLISQINAAPVSNLLLVESNLSDDINIEGALSEACYLSEKGRQLTFAQKSNLPNKNEIAWTEILVNANGRLNDDMNFTINNERQNINSELKFKFIKDAEKATYPDSIEKFLLTTYGRGVIYGDNFSKNKNELYISELLLERLGFSNESALNSSISLNVDYKNTDPHNQRYILDDDTIYDNQHIKRYDKILKIPDITGKVQIFKDYKIVGIISKEYFEINSLTKIDADIWMKEDSLINSAGITIFPKLSIQDLYFSSFIEPKIVLTYLNTDYINYSNEITAEGCFFPFFINNNYIQANRGANNTLLPLLVSFVQCDSFSETKKYAQQIDEIIMLNYASESFYSPCNEVFILLRQINNTTNIISLILAIIGGVSLMTVLINYGNILSFKARKSANFLEMMRKIGISKKDKTRIIQLETFGSFAFAALSAFVLGLIISSLIKFVFSTIFSDVFSYMSISIWAFFPAYLSVVLIIGIVVATISKTTISQL